MNTGDKNMNRKTVLSGFLAGMGSISVMTSHPSVSSYVVRKGDWQSDFEKVGDSIRFAMNEFSELELKTSSRPKRLKSNDR